MRQPALGAASAVLVFVLSWLVIAVMGADVLLGWGSFVFMGAIPFGIVFGAFWKGTEPAGVARLRQPVRGVALVVIAAVVAAVVSLAAWAGLGGTVSPPPPMAAQPIIVSVVLTFCLAIALDGWPFSLLRHRLLGGVALLVTVYVLDVLVSRLMSFGFAAGEPFYRPELDPHGPVDAWTVVAVAVSALATMFYFLHFGGSPYRPRGTPASGLAFAATCLVIAVVAERLGTAGGMPTPTYLVTVPIPLLSGSIVVLTVFRGGLTERIRAPYGPIVSAVVATVLGLLLARLYVLVMPLLSGPQPAGPEGGFTAELWLANALLGVTFPLLAVHGDYFEFWPFARPPEPADAQLSQAREAPQE